VKSEASSIGKYVAAMLCGIVLTALYVRFGYTAPTVVQLGSKVAAEVVVTTAEVDLYDSKAPHEVRQRALAIVVGQRPDLFVEVDDAIGNQFFEEVLRRKAVRKAKLIKQRMRGYEMALAKPALRRHQERRFGVKETELLKQRMLIADIHEDEFLDSYLRRRFPEASGDDLANLVLNVYQNGLRSDSPQTAAQADFETGTLR